jgi:NhaA family Na+:H+ antiporter
MGAASLPVGVQWRHVTIIGMAAGIGFTMALFIAELAFPSSALLEIAKLSILCGSALSSALALGVGFRFGR